MIEPERTHRRARAEGFTLIEMMVSVTLVALIALSLWGAMRICLSSWKRGTEAMDTNQRQRAILDLVEKQMTSISGLVPPLDLQTGAGQSPIFWGTASSVQFVSLCPLHFRDNPGLTSVTYDIVPGDGGDYVLVQRESRYLGGDPTLDPASPTPAESGTTILDHLLNASFEYYDPGNPETPAQWVSDWNAQDKASLPAAISMTMSTRGTAGVIETHKLIVPIMAEPDNLTNTYVDPFDGRGGFMGTNPFMGGRGAPGQPMPGRRGGGPDQPGGRRGGPGDMGPPGGRRGPGIGGPPPPGGRRGGDFFNNPVQGPGRGGRFE